MVAVLDWPGGGDGGGDGTREFDVQAGSHSPKHTLGPKRRSL